MYFPTSEPLAFSLKAEPLERSNLIGNVYFTPVDAMEKRYNFYTEREEARKQPKEIHFIGGQFRGGVIMPNPNPYDEYFKERDVDNFESSFKSMRDKIVNQFTDEFFHKHGYTDDAQMQSLRYQLLLYNYQQQFSETFEELPLHVQHLHRLSDEDRAEELAAMMIAPGFEPYRGD